MKILALLQLFLWKLSVVQEAAWLIHQNTYRVCVHYVISIISALFWMKSWWAWLEQVRCSPFRASQELYLILSLLQRELQAHFYLWQVWELVKKSRIISKLMLWDGAALSRHIQCLWPALMSAWNIIWIMIFPDMYANWARLWKREWRNALANIIAWNRADLEVSLELLILWERMESPFRNSSMILVRMLLVNLNKDYWKMAFSCGLDLLFSIVHLLLLLLKNN